MEDILSSVLAMAITLAVILIMAALDVRVERRELDEFRKYWRDFTGKGK